jgi:3-oxoacyl-[acyl-carrier-protein] synthase II
MQGKVAITGMGLLTPLGRGPEQSWNTLADGSNSLTRDPEGDGPEWMRWAGRVDEVELPENLPRSILSQTRFLNRGGRLGLTAAHDALTQAGSTEHSSSERRALFLATGDLTAADCESLHPATSLATNGNLVDRKRLNRETIARVNPFFLLEGLANNPYSVLAAVFEFEGPGTTLASQSPAGAQALDLAYRSVTGGRSDLALVVGCGSWLSMVPRFEMAGLGLLSRCRDGGRSYRPFDRRRDGFIVGEGAAALVFETEDSARARGATIHATVESTSSGLEPAPGLGVADQVTTRCMDLALEGAGLTTRSLGFVCPHGSGTRKGDGSEGASLAAILNGNPGLPICALKPYTGHMGAASDIAEVILGILGTSKGIVPATPNFDTGDPNFEGLSISASSQACTQPRFLSISYGLGGQSVSVVVAAPRAEGG